MTSMPRSASAAISVVDVVPTISVKCAARSIARSRFSAPACLSAEVDMARTSVRSAVTRPNSQSADTTRSGALSSLAAWATCAANSMGRNR